MERISRSRRFPPSRSIKELEQVGCRRADYRCHRLRLSGTPGYRGFRFPLGTRAALRNVANLRYAASCNQTNNDCEHRSNSLKRDCNIAGTTFISPTHDGAQTTRSSLRHGVLPLLFGIISYWVLPARIKCRTTLRFAVEHATSVSRGTVSFILHRTNVGTFN